ncbi:MAG: sugar acetyltransferase [Peptococcaceae bacterium BRH_c4b]|nr:MAG: sugar acetyltransferase [Peptococcaceae bacterium BRH_c4b]
MNMPLIIIGGGGHARVLIDTLLLCGLTMLGVTDTDRSKWGASILGVPVLGDDSIIDDFPADKICLVNGLGMVGMSSAREGIYRLFKNKGYNFVNIVHPSAVMAGDVKLSEGVQIMAGSIIQTGASIGCNTIVNSGVIVEHDCSIGSFVHLATGVTLCGGVNIGDKSFIGAGTTIIQGLSVGSSAKVGAGSVVIRDLPDSVTAVGIPAKVVPL